jgi:transcriptional regulator with XRE-family HTH domain
VSQTRVSLAEHVATRLRVEMARADVTIGELAQRLGESPVWVARRMRGRVPITLADLDRIATALGVSPVDFVTTAERVS